MKLSEKKQLNKTKNTVKGVSAGLINRIVSLLLPFLVRTLLIKYIGIDYAGLNGLFSSILQVLNIAELGFSSAVVYSMYKPIAENDDATICALLKYYRTIYRIIGIVILIAGLICMPFLSHLINGTPPAGANIYIIFSLYLLGTSVSYLLYGYKISLLNAYQRVDVIQHIGTIISLITSVSQIAVIIIFDNFYIYVTVIPLVAIIRNIVTSYIVDHLFPQYKCTGRISENLKKDIQKKVIGLSIQKICGVSRDGITNIIISAFISLSVVGIYNNYFMIFSALTGILALVPSSMTAGIGNYVQTASVEENYRALQRFNLMYMVISTICAVCLFSLYQPFMQLWLGKEYMFSYSTVILIVLYFYLLKMGDIRSIWVDAVGLYWEIKWRAVLESVLNIGLSIIFVQRWGINGIIAGTITSLFLMNFLYSSSITFKYYFGHSKLIPFYLTQLFHLSLMVIIAGICFYIFDKLDNIFQITNLWFILGYRLCISVTISIIILLFALHRFQSYKESKIWLMKKISKH